MTTPRWSPTTGRSALELAGASGEETADLTDNTRVALADAGDRAISPQRVRPCRGVLRRGARAVAATTAAGRAELLFRRAHALHVTGDERQADALEEARDALLAHRRQARQRSSGSVSLACGMVSRTRRRTPGPYRAGAKSSSPMPGPTVAKARVLCLSARLLMLSNDDEEAIRTGSEALALAEQLDLDELRIHALDDDRYGEGLARPRRRRGARARARARAVDQLAARGERAQQPRRARDAEGRHPPRRGVQSGDPRERTSSSATTRTSASHAGTSSTTRCSGAAGTKRLRRPIASSRSAKPRHTTWRTPHGRCAHLSGLHVETSRVR